MKNLILASDNTGKLKELRRLLTPLGWTLLAQKELGISAAEEPHPTFLENALTKARWAAEQGGMPALADDSGICVTALQGAPGVRSARYAGAQASDEANNQKLLQAMAACTDRRAYYYCVLVLCRTALDPCPIICEGRWSGEILHAPRGTTGFGYDPLFWLPDLKASAGELSADEKNKASHRGQAIAQLLAQLQQLGE